MFMIRVIVIMFFLYLQAVLAAEFINLGKFKNDPSIYKEKDIDKLSQKFLAVEYVANTLENKDINTSKENLVINFEALDCFTFIDTFDALKRSKDFKDFKNNLISTRYIDSVVSYQNRNHFFSNWVVYNDIEDITCKLGACKKASKVLNKDQIYLKEIEPIKRDIYYINPKDIDTKKLKNGDYIGIYSDKDDLDVTHTGIIIKKEGKIFIRHASSLLKKVIDSELFEYTAKKEGVIIYRSKI